MDGEYRCSLTPYEEQRIHYLDTPAEGETLEVTIACNTPLSSLDWNALVQQLDQDALSNALALLDNTQVDTVTNSRVSLQATADTSSTLVTTIPAEDGWTAYVDGKKVDTGVCLDTFLTVELTPGTQDTFLTVELTPGTHQVTFRYTSPGLILGLGLGGITAVAFLGWLVWKRKKA